MQTIELPGWVYYIPGGEDIPNIPNCGKWMYFFNESNYDFAKSMCRRAIQGGVVKECKHTCKAVLELAQTGVCCFYCDGNDKEAHKAILSFLMANNMIGKTKSGKYTNISFKFDKQTDNKEYDKDFEAKIRLSDFVDLQTGEWLDTTES